MGLRCGVKGDVPGSLLVKLRDLFCAAWGGRFMMKEKYGTLLSPGPSEMVATTAFANNAREQPVIFGSLSEACRSVMAACHPYLYTRTVLSCPVPKSFFPSERAGFDSHYCARCTPTILISTSEIAETVAKKFEGSRSKRAKYPPKLYPTVLGVSCGIHEPKSPISRVVWSISDIHCEPAAFDEGGISVLRVDVFFSPNLLPPRIRGC